MTTTTQNHNLSIWNAVEKTDPAHTKKFSGVRGGFSGTAVNQTYQMRRATELFGPVGIGWGFDEVEHTIVDGAKGDKVWFSKVKLWYLFEGRRGEVLQWGATTFVGTNKNGPFTDEEAGKKSITDAVGKCLSLLGFSADVYLGQFDDQKYVNDRRREEAGKKQASGVRRQGSGAETSREVSPPANGNGHAAAPGRRVSSPASNAANGHGQRTSDNGQLAPDLAAFRDAIAAATLESDARRAEYLFRAERERSGRPLSEVESSLVASCTQAACERIEAAKAASGVRRQASGRNGHAAAPDLAAIAKPANGLVTGAHLMQPRGSGTAHPHPSPQAAGGTTRAKPQAQNPAIQDAGPQLRPDITAFREFCEHASQVTDVKRGEHVLRSKRLRDGIGMGDAESELVARCADAACRRIRAARKGGAA